MFVFLRLSSNLALTVLRQTNNTLPSRVGDKPTTPPIVTLVVKTVDTVRFLFLTIRSTDTGIDLVFDPVLMLVVILIRIVVMLVKVIMARVISLSSVELTVIVRMVHMVLVWMVSVLALVRIVLVVERVVLVVERVI